MKKANSFQKTINQIIVKIKQNKKQVGIIATLAVLLTTSIIVLVKGDQNLSASVTNLGGYGYGQTSTGPVVDCKKAEIVLACALGTRNCPVECKGTPKPDGYGYGQVATGPVVTTTPLCKRAEIVLACALGTKNCPTECKAPVNRNDPKPRVIFPPKRR